MTLKDPSEYMPQLNSLRAHNQYAKDWKLRIEKRTNRHPETGGGPWGWYEICPLGIHIAFWGTNRDDLKGVDIADWNRRAEEVSMPRKDEK